MDELPPLPDEVFANIVHMAGHLLRGEPLHNFETASGDNEEIVRSIASLTAASPRQRTTAVAAAVTAIDDGSYHETTEQQVRARLKAEFGIDCKEVG